MRGDVRWHDSVETPLSEKSFPLLVSLLFPFVEMVQEIYGNITPLIPMRGISRISESREGISFWEEIGFFWIRELDSLLFPICLRLSRGKGTRRSNCIIQNCWFSVSWTWINQNTWILYEEKQIQNCVTHKYIWEQLICLFSQYLLLILISYRDYEINYSIEYIFANELILRLKTKRKGKNLLTTGRIQTSYEIPRRLMWSDTV